MVVGIIVYQFELSVDESGEIEPNFKELASEFVDEFKEMPMYEIISINDLFSIYYSHTTGARAGFEGEKKTKMRNFFVGRLKESPYQVISYFREGLGGKHYMTISIFKMTEDSERFESIVHVLAGKMDVTLDRMAKGNLKSIAFVQKIEKAIKSDIKYAIFQIERLTNLSKRQKVGLLYLTPERETTLEMLRSGPVGRTALQYELEKIKQNPNIDLILRPFTELNLIRRDWGEGVKDKRSGIIWGQGEYIFLVKDIVLARKPPKTIIDKMSKNEDYGSKYMEMLKDFYTDYIQNVDYVEESKLLSRFLLNPDINDLLALLGNRSYAREKMPKVMSEFSDVEQVIEDLIDSKIVAAIEDSAGREWICLLGEITPIMVFPEYMVKNIQKRLMKQDRNLVDMHEHDPLTDEVARKSLELLEASYGEKLEF